MSEKKEQSLNSLGVIPNKPIATVKVDGKKRKKKYAKKESITQSLLRLLGKEEKF